MNVHPPVRKERIDALGATLLIGFSALLGLNQVLMKLVNQGMNPVFQAGLRSAVALVPVLIYALWRNRIAIRQENFWPGVVTGLLFSFEFLLLFKALDFTTVVRTSVLFYTMPIWVALMAHFLIPGERLSPVRLLGLALATVGTIVALLHNAKPATEYALVGDLMALAGATGWAGLAIVVRTTPLGRATPETALLYQLTISAPILLAASLAFGSAFREMTPELWAIFAFQALGIAAAGFLLWFWVLSVYPTSDMASFAFLAPLFGVTFGWLLLGEQLSINIIIALVLVGAGIWLVNQRSRR